MKTKVRIEKTFDTVKVFRVKKQKYYRENGQRNIARN